MGDEAKSYDPNMELAYPFARNLASAPTLPHSLASVERRAELVHRMDGPFVQGRDLAEVLAWVGTRVRVIAEITKDYIPDIPDSVERVSIALRLWSGCISAAKTIAYETRSGPNTPESRAQIMPLVDRVAATGEIYAAGVEAAPTFKKIRNQGFSFEGVPEDSRVRRYP